MSIKITKNKLLEIIEESILENKEMLWEYYNKFDEYRKQNESELWHYHVLRKRRTRLPVNIFVDNAHSYKRCNHRLWMYFQNDYRDDSNYDNILPISVEDNPKLLVNPNKLKIRQSDYQKIIKFVVISKKILIAIANETIDDDEFYWQLDMNLLELNEIFNNQKMLLNEMAKTLYPKNTGLPVPIWLDEDNLNIRGGHGPRIKFEALKGTTTLEWTSMTIEDNPQVIEDTFPNKATIKNHQIRLIQKFVFYNKDLLLKLIKKQIDYDTEFLPNMIRLDGNGNPIYPQKKQQYRPAAKPQFGFTMVKSNDNLFNFTNSNRELVSSNQWFTNAKNFQKYGNNIIAASVELDNKWYWLYPNGKLKLLV